MFAPNYIENKLSSSPISKKRLRSGWTQRGLRFHQYRSAVGNWAERRNLPYAGYTDLAGKPQVYDLIKSCVEQVNAELATDPMLADSQIHRFLLLHKELDPDDDELTRTRKVRRGFIGEKYSALIDALYSGRSAQRVETGVKFEDGRTGTIAADVQIKDAKLSAVRTQPEAALG